MNRKTSSIDWLCHSPWPPYIVPPWTSVGTDWGLLERNLTAFQKPLEFLGLSFQTYAIFAARSLASVQFRWILYCLRFPVDLALLNNRFFFFINFNSGLVNQGRLCLDLRNQVDMYCSIIDINWLTHFSHVALTSSDIIDSQSKSAIASQAPSQFACVYLQILRPLLLVLGLLNALLIIAMTP